MRKLTTGSESYVNLEKELLSLQEVEEKDTVLAVDCSSNSKLCGDFDVVSFPTIRLHRKDGTVERYRGPRRAKQYAATSCLPLQ